MTSGKGSLASVNGSAAAVGGNEPQPAENIIAFGGTPGVASKLDYSVPQPGHHDGRRILALTDLNVGEGEWTAAAKGGPDLASEVGLQSAGDNEWTVDANKAVDFWLERAKLAGVPGDEVAAVEELVDHEGAHTHRRTLFCCKENETL